MSNLEQQAWSQELENARRTAARTTSNTMKKYAPPLPRRPRPTVGGRRRKTHRRKTHRRKTHRRKTHGKRKTRRHR
jgi:hypothetical protein